MPQASLLLLATAGLTLVAAACAPARPTTTPLAPAPHPPVAAVGLDELERRCDEDDALGCAALARALDGTDVLAGGRWRGPAAPDPGRARTYRTRACTLGNLRSCEELRAASIFCATARRR